MIDLHSHILPYMDDGASSMEDALAIARMAVSDGIKVMACTPHIVPGLYDNDRVKIVAAVKVLRKKLKEEEIGLDIIVGADVHAAPDLVKKLHDKTVPTIHDSRYFLFEPPHHILPPRLGELVERLIEAGFLPILTHPERLTWIRTHYEVITRINAMGCLMQITAGSLTGTFGKTARHFAERMLDEGRVDILATDTHNTRGRPPILSAARQFVEERLGAEEAQQMVFDRPARIILNEPLTAVGADKSISANQPEATGVSSLVGRLFGKQVT